ncbi:MAG: MBL fold metallo-hydrolase [Clostridia bacterium]|nr:MBL fold metallo-hydrolase [Clostridia bacterium]
MNKNAKQKITLGIILILVIVLCALYVQFNNANPTNNLTNKYSNVIINNEKLNIFYFKVGQADCTLITINNKNLLIDAGNKSDGDYIVEFLKEKKLDTIDYFIITHGDLDHSGGAGNVLNNCNVKNMFMPEGIEEAEENYQSLKSVADSNNVQLSKVEISDKFDLDKANFEILSVKNNTNSSANESSIVVKLNYLNTSYLFMGDATQGIEKEIKSDSVDVLKVGHHGSNSSTSSEFLDMIKPKYAIISAGINAKYNHPAEQILQRLRDANIQEKNIYITNNQGTIWLTSDGTNIEIQTRQDINLDGTGQIGKVDILNICSFFNRINYSLLAC